MGDKIFGWYYRSHEMYGGRGFNVYDEDGIAVAQGLTEERARLVAAAPHLLNALTALVSDRHGHSADCACPWCNARAAIAKASPTPPLQED